ncbi:hypothetical protein [Bisbaumannia pacifica]|uniref:Uncharacterized protein n=1 Tax=Bisbaumannia pacifica TaxID=77098 RepID=A0ABD4KZH1_9GAMM|nr:hypothetical protein [Halomonas pacifica]MBH8578782.1 hypothetical protein [Halomonas pacifica]
MNERYQVRTIFDEADNFTPIRWEVFDTHCHDHAVSAHDSYDEAVQEKDRLNNDF